MARRGRRRRRIHFLLELVNTRQGAIGLLVRSLRLLLSGIGCLLGLLRCRHCFIRAMLSPCHIRVGSTATDNERRTYHRKSSDLSEIYVHVISSLCILPPRVVVNTRTTIR